MADFMSCQLDNLGLVKTLYINSPKMHNTILKRLFKATPLKESIY